MLQGLSLEHSTTSDDERWNCGIAHRHFMKIAGASHLPTITKLLGELFQESHRSEICNDLVHRLLFDLCPVIRSTLRAATRLCFGLADIFKSMSKTSYVMARATAALLKHGYGMPPPMDDDGDGEDGDDGKQFDGTGMGDGEGQRDVSDQIDDEEQLLGLKGDEQTENDQPEQTDADTGVEMQSDFDGELYNMQDTQEERDDEEDEESDDELDREMMDFDGEEDEEVSEPAGGAQVV